MTADAPAAGPRRARADGRPRQHFIFVLIGSGGDILPAMAIAAELVLRDHDVVVHTYEAFAKDAVRAGVPFEAIETSAHYAQMSKDAWKAGGVARGLDQDGYLERAVAPAFERVEALRNASPCVVCTRSAFGARFAAEKFGLPLICLAYNATQFASPTCFPYSRSWLARLPLPLRRGWFHLSDKANRAQRGKVNAMRARFALPAIDNVRQWGLFGAPSLALFPSWYADMKTCAPAAVRQAGFIFTPDAQPPSLPPQVSAFIDRPGVTLVFTFGTGVSGILPLFEKAAQVTAALGYRAIFVTRFRENIPEHLPPDIMLLDHIDFAALLPRIDLLVHHGGIGTIAQAIRSGIPQVIVPLAFDMPDNAHRFRQLGLAELVSGMRCSPRALTRSIERALRRIPKARLQALSRQMRTERGIELAADACEDMLAEQMQSQSSQKNRARHVA